MPGDFQRVVFASELPECEHGCGEKYCYEHDKHYYDCACIGPTEDDVEYKTIDGVLYGRRV